MKAAVIRRYGGPEVLEIEERPVPVPRADEALVAVRASSVNPRDWLIRSGRYPFQALVPGLPLVLGSDVAGRVVALGRRVRSLALGQPVFGMVPSRRGFGAYAEYAAVPARSLAPIPSGVSFEAAAAAPLAALTAWQGLLQDARLARWQADHSPRVLVVGASGGVGSFAVQIARGFGAEVVAVCSGRNRELVAGLGAERVIDYQVTDPMLDEGTYDIVFDAVGRHSLAASRRLLTPGGIYVTTVPRRPQIAEWWSSSLRARVSPRTPRAAVVLVRSEGRHLAEIGRRMGHEEIRSLIDTVYPLEEIREAHRHSETFRARGKLVLRVSEDGGADAAT